MDIEKAHLAYDVGRRTINHILYIRYNVELICLFF